MKDFCPKMDKNKQFLYNILHCYLGNGSNDLDLILYYNEILLYKFDYMRIFPDKNAILHINDRQCSSIKMA